MKNIKFLMIFFIFCFFNMNSSVHGFLGEDLGLDLYNKIDEGYSEMNQKNFEYELSGSDKTIKDKINNLINISYPKIANGKACISGDLAPSHIQAIANGDIEILNSKLSNDCKPKDATLTADIHQLKSIQEVIKTHYNKTIFDAKIKTQKTQKIGSLGLYTDGNTQNSPFDLIKDIEKIDAIIFSNPASYAGEEYFNAGKYFDNKINDKKIEEQENTQDKNVLNEIQGKKTAYEVENQSGGISLDFLGNTQDEYTCVDPSRQNHGLSNEEIEQLIGDNSGSQNSNNSSGNDNSQDLPTNISDNSKNNAESISGNYSKVNDNAQWPCVDFYCITVEFKTYNHQLLTGGDNSIEFLINRSNGHLKKFVNSSLVPAKMTVNNFELGLSDLNLPDLFHMSFQIQTKPVPILKLRGEKSKDSNQNSANVMLEKIYKSYDLDYQRRNDISRFKKVEKEFKSIMDSVGSDINQLDIKHNQLTEYLNTQSKKSDHISEQIFNQVTRETLGDFEDQFVELVNFSKSINQYTHDLKNLTNLLAKVKQG